MGPPRVVVVHVLAHLLVADLSHAPLRSTQGTEGDHTCGAYILQEEPDSCKRCPSDQGNDGLTGPVILRRASARMYMPSTSHPCYL